MIPVIDRCPLYRNRSAGRTHLPLDPIDHSPTSLSVVRRRFDIYDLANRIDNCRLAPKKVLEYLVWCHLVAQEISLRDSRP